MKEHSIAIDFGTTKTLVSHINPQTGHPETIRLGRGSDYLPTTAYRSSDGDFFFGEEANDKIADEDGQYVSSFKMEIGSTIPLISYNMGSKWHHLTAKDIVYKFLKYIREEVQKIVFFGESVTSATITHPVVFTPGQLNELKLAAKAAGFKHVTFITEPEAAGIAFCKLNASDNFQKNALVIDWGGGTLDIALVSRHNGKISTHADYTTGNDVGGEKFDDYLWNHILEQPEISGSDKLDSITQIKYVQRGKEILSKKETVKIHLTSASGQAFPGVQITRSAFNKLIKADVDNASDMVQNLLQRIPREKKPELILLVGGSSMIPFIKESLEQACGLPARSWHKSRDAVSLGAAYHVEDVRKKQMMQDCLNEQSLVTILRQGMNPNSTVECTTEEGKTFTRPLIFIPIEKNNIKCLEILLEHGADINACDSEGQSALHCAVDEGNAKMVKFLLNHQANPNIQDNDGWTALHCAALERADKCIELLLKGGANPNIQDNNGSTALHYTCFEPEEDDEYTIDDCCRCVQLLIEHNCHLSTKDKDGDTPLLQALRKESYHTAKLLYKAGADTNIKNNNGECANGYLPDSWKQQKQIAKFEDKQSAIEELAKEYDITGSYDKELISAAQKGATKRLNLLISAGANINYTDSDKKCTALSLAVQNQRIETVKILLTQPNIDINKDLPLEKAVKNDAMECFNLLLEATTIDVNSAIHAAAQQKNPQFLYKLLNRNEANVNKKNANGLTPLHLAAAKNNTDHVNRLLQHHSIDVNMEAMNGNSALMLAISAGSTGAFGQLIKNKNLRINHRNNDGYTALHVAIQMKASLELIDHLVAYEGININAKTTKEGKTPLLLALENNYISAALRLLKRNPSINEKDIAGDTALHIAARNNQTEMIKELLNVHGLRANETNNKGLTPLHIAIVEHNGSVVQYLVNHNKININVISGNMRRTPLHTAIAFKYYEMVEYLTSHEKVSLSINLKDALGYTPLHLAVKGGRSDIVQLLLKVKDIDVNSTDNSGDTPLHLAVACDQRYMLELLLKTPRINVNACNNEGNTPLHIAAMNNFHKVVQILADRKDIYINQKNKKGETPYKLTVNLFDFLWTNSSQKILKNKGGRE